MIRTKGEAGTGDIVEAVRHMRAVQKGIRLAWHDAGAPAEVVLDRQRANATGECRRREEHARAFAVHAAGQVERSRSADGRRRYTLWTGDLGTALYLADCMDGRGTLPLP